MSKVMEEWLTRDLFDEIPEGVPPLDPEDDDEGTDQPDDHDDGDHGMEPETYAVQDGPDSIDTDTSVCIVALPGLDLPGPQDPKHATLLYLGHIGGDGAPALGDYQSLLANVTNIAAKATRPFASLVKKIEPLGDEGAQVWVMEDTGGYLAKLRDDLLETDSEINSLYEDGTFTKYPEFLPHVTIGYETDDATTSLVSEDLEEAAQIEEIIFDRLALWFGDEHIEFPLAAGAEFVWDESDHKRGEAGTPTGGRFIPGKGGSKSRDKADSEEAKKGPLAKRREMVKAILKALSSIMDDLTSQQARALISRIEENAQAFLEGQEKGRASGGGSKSGGGSDKGGADSKGPDKGGPRKGGDSPDKKGDSGPAGTISAIVKSVEGLLKGFAQNMKAEDRKALTDAVDNLKEMD